MYRTRSSDVPWGAWDPEEVGTSSEEATGQVRHLKVLHNIERSRINVACRWMAPTAPTLPQPGAYLSNPVALPLPNPRDTLCSCEAKPME